MFKRIVSCLLLVLMLIPVISPVFATTANNISQVNRNEAPSVESILNEYHEKVFAAQADANANARSGAEVQTDAIKQDTLNQLREAGYLAYDVNPDTFDSVAEELRTDLRQMDLDPNSSYIIVISGEEEPQENTASPAYIPPEIEDDTEGFNYTYNGTLYKLKFMTVVGDPNNGRLQAGSYDLFDINNNDGNNPLSIIFETAISMWLDSLTPYPIGTIASLVKSVYLNQDYMQAQTLVFHASANWTQKYTLIRSQSDQQFYFGSRVEYVNVRCWCTGLIYDESICNNVPYSGEVKENNIYSEYYNNTEQQKIQAVLGYINGIPNTFITGPVEIKYGENTILRFNGFY